MMIACFEGDTSESGGESFTDQLDIQHYVRILRKRKWPIALFTAAVVALAAYYAYTATPVYSSTSTLLIESQDQNLVQFDELVGLDTENQDYYETQFELLRSRGLALRVRRAHESVGEPRVVSRASRRAIHVRRC